MQDGLELGNFKPNFWEQGSNCGSSNPNLKNMEQIGDLDQGKSSNSRSYELDEASAHILERVYHHRSKSPGPNRDWNLLCGDRIISSISCYWKQSSNQSKILN